MSSEAPKAGGRTGSRAGLGTSSGRPTTGRPLTARPTTAAARPGTARARPATGRVDEEEYDDDYYDEEDYESEDDGDVFAFVPPELGAAPEVVQTSDVAGAAAPDIAAASAAEDEETFYYDENTGAVYDGQGRLVQMPAGFDASEVQRQAQPEGEVTQLPSAEAPFVADRAAEAGPTSEVLPGDPNTLLPVTNARDWESATASAAPSYRGQSFDDPGSSKTKLSSLDRQDSNGSSFANTPALRHAGSNSNFSPLDMLPEMRSNSGSRQVSREGTAGRDVGYTITGTAQLDQARRGSAQSGIELLPSHNTMRQRNNRSSQLGNAGLTPTTEMKFKLDSSYDDFDDMKATYGQSPPLGEGPGMVHPNLEFQDAAAGAKGLRMVELEMETEEDSPYPEVRASVSNIDDPDMLVNTIRAWFLCFVLSTIAGALNMLLNFRTPAPYLAPIVVQLIAYPCGKLMAAILPIRTWTLPRWLGGASFSLNPGMFTIKEHTLISIVLNISITQAYAINSTIALNSVQFFNVPRPLAFSILYVIASQVIGFSLSGLSRRFLVYPASMVWPLNLVTATILNTLHAEEDGHDGTMTRFRYFTFILGGSMIWYFVPGFLFQGLSSFGWLCWIWPNNFIVNTLFGTTSGLGLSVLTFDWSQVTYIGSPLVYPWWAECNMIAGFIIIEIIIGLSLYFSNVLNASYFPFNTPGGWDRFGQPYDISSIITDNAQLNVAAYEEYSTIYLATTYVLVYSTGFAIITAVLVHTALYHGKALWRGIRNQRTEEDDIHAKLMRRYREVPEWWYALVGVIMFAISIIVVEVWDTSMPVWALLLAVLIPVIYVLPMGFIYAMTGASIGTNLIGEFVAGYVLPGNPIANQIFKVFSVQTLNNTLLFTQDLKLGHYMKVPPRLSFVAQFIFAIWVSIVQVGVQQFMFTHITDICSPDQVHRFTCPHARTFYTASIVWGVIGPERLFGKSGAYESLYWCMLIGAFLPLPFWLLSRKYPKSWIKFVSVPVALNSVAYIPPASGLVYTSWFTGAFIFQYLIRKYNFRWWSKYNFVTSAGLDSGTIIGTLLVFLVLQLPRDGAITLNWWGNSVTETNLDWIGAPWRQAPTEGFAPAPRDM